MVDIKIIGTNSINGTKLENLCYKVVRENQYQAHISTMPDINVTKGQSLNDLPILMINEKTFSTGKLPSKEELKLWIDDLLKDYFY